LKRDTLKNRFKGIAEYLKRGTLKYLRLDKKDLILEARYA